MSLRRTNPVYEILYEGNDEEHLKDLIASVLRDLDSIKGIIQNNQQVEETVEKQISQLRPDSFVVKNNIVEDIMKLADKFPRQNQNGGKKRKTLKRKGKSRRRHNKSKLHTRRR